MKLIYFFIALSIITRCLILLQAGTIGAIGGNNLGVTSINPDSSQYSFYIGKGLKDNGSGSNSGVMASISNCVSNGAKIISMSLGGGPPSTIVANQFQSHYEEDGVLFVAAAGNDGNSALSYPASYPHVISVAAHDIDGNKASFSQYNNQVELSGPGMLRILNSIQFFFPIICSPSNVF